MSDTWAVLRHSGRLRKTEDGQRIADIRTVMEITGGDESEDKIRQIYSEIAGKLKAGYVCYTKNGIEIERHRPGWTIWKAIQ